jgi:diguanylate cyclase (GGDEF)-like protein
MQRLERVSPVNVRRPALVVYFLCCVVGWSLLPLDAPIRWLEVGPAIALQVVIGLAMAFGERRRAGRSSVGGITGVVAFMIAVALLRDGMPPSAGFGPLVLLPVVWASLGGRRRELAVAVVGVALVYVVPAVLIGAPHYPTGSWRAGLLFSVISGGLGVAVVGLVRRVEQLLRQLDEVARVDELTGLPNKRAWGALLEHELAAMRRTGAPFSIALIDLDLFKEYNDTHGHLAADQMLRRASAAWVGTLRETDALARWGGDEFALLLTGSGADRAVQVLERMRAACPEVQFSAGAAEAEYDSTPDSIVAAADEALYEAKRANKRDAVRHRPATLSVHTGLPLR